MHFWSEGTELLVLLATKIVHLWSEGTELLLVLLAAKIVHLWSALLLVLLAAKIVHLWSESTELLLVLLREFVSQFPGASVCLILQILQLRTAALQSLLGGAEPQSQAVFILTQFLQE